MNLFFRFQLIAVLSGMAWFTLFHGAVLGADTLSWSQALRQDSHWYDSAEAIRVADNVLVYQHENGGWPKNIDIAKPLSDEDKIRIRNESGRSGTSLSQTTIDNKATSTEMQYLARVVTVTGGERFATGFLRGLDYLLEAQYDNGGWPQYYPTRAGYYERITFNDGAMIGVMRLLRDVAAGKDPYAFVEEARGRKVATALEKGLDVILKAQIEVDGKLTAWCAQHDEHDLSPAGARSYEHPSISGSESVAVVRYLMTIENPGPEIVAAIRNAVAWFEEAQIKHTRVINIRTDGQRDRVVQTDPSYGSSWARFHEIETNRPIFSGRDGVIKYELAEIERERRVGYSWLGNWGRDLLEKDYPAWQEKWMNE